MQSYESRGRTASLEALKSLVENLTYMLSDPAFLVLGYRPMTFCEDNPVQFVVTKYNKAEIMISAPLYSKQPCVHITYALDSKLIKPVYDFVRDFLENEFEETFSILETQTDRLWEIDTNLIVRSSFLNESLAAKVLE